MTMSEMITRKNAFANKALEAMVGKILAEALSEERRTEYSQTRSENDTIERALGDFTHTLGSIGYEGGIKPDPNRQRHINKICQFYADYPYMLKIANVLKAFDDNPWAAFLTAQNMLNEANPDNFAENMLTVFNKVVMNDAYKLRSLSKKYLPQ